MPGVYKNTNVLMFISNFDQVACSINIDMVNRDMRSMNTCNGYSYVGWNPMKY